MGGFSNASFAAWLTTREIADRYRFPSAAAARRFILRYGVQKLRRGRVILVDVRDFEASCRQLLNKPGFFKQGPLVKAIREDLAEAQAVAMEVVR